METKRGVSLVVLVIAIIILIVITGATIIQISNGLYMANKNDFVTELNTIENKIKEHYILIGSLPIISGETYTANEVKDKLTDISSQELLEQEIQANKDINNTFCKVDLDKIEVITEKRGKTNSDTDVFLVATNTLNVYYLAGAEIEGVIRFSVVDLVDENNIELEQENDITNVDLNTQLALEKSTNTWTNELVITVKNVLKQNEELQYSIAGAEYKNIDGNEIVINANNMTDNEKSLFLDDKNITVSRMVNSIVEETKSISIDNLDILAPIVSGYGVVDSANAEYNIVEVDSYDEGQSGVKYLYYEYQNKLIDGDVAPYYNNLSKMTKEKLLGFGKVTNNGVIKLEKNVKSFFVMAVDNAGNMSNIKTYILEDQYVISE